MNVFCSHIKSCKQKVIWNKMNIFLLFNIKESRLLLFFVIATIVMTKWGFYQNILYSKNFAFACINDTLYE